MFKRHQPALAPVPPTFPFLFQDWSTAIFRWERIAAPNLHPSLMLFGFWLGLLAVDQEKPHSPEQQQQEQERQQLKHGMQMQDGHPSSPCSTTSRSAQQPATAGKTSQLLRLLLFGFWCQSAAAPERRILSFAYQPRGFPLRSFPSRLG